MAFLRTIFRWLLRWLLRAALILLLLFAALAALWAYAPAVSTLMLARWATFRPVERVWTPLERLGPALPLAVIAAEDGRFCRHRGVDWLALRQVIDEASEDGPARGASTIAMQSAKNLFLWPSRSALRKGLEIPAALAIDGIWGKRRVMEVYLNIAEWGEGLFGAEAAAQRYFHKSAAALTLREAARGGLFSSLDVARKAAQRHELEPSGKEGSAHLYYLSDLAGAAKGKRG
jgi:monofunctional biosynthetic peptidoglycan transglycosylase